MTTPLHSTLKRALTIQGREYVVTLTSESLKITLKGKRNGVELAWANIVSGDAALAVALNASVGALDPIKRAERPLPRARPPTSIERSESSAGTTTRKPSKPKHGTRVPARTSARTSARVRTPS
jgi:hypothetical protein